MRMKKAKMLLGWNILKFMYIPKARQKKTAQRHKKEKQPNQNCEMGRNFLPCFSFSI